MLQVENISFAYDDVLVVKNISFELGKGECLSLIGASGCGKSTLLKLICGQYDLLEGKITLDQQPIYGPSRHLVVTKDAIKYLTQDSELMPYISVAQNVGKFLSNMYPRKKQQRVDELLEMVEMQDYKEVQARYLSGGQQQRVALAMALAKEPKLLLLDEPFSHIDSFLKNSLQRNLFSYLKSKEITCIVATHTPKDALAFSDKIIVMREGKKIEEKTPNRLYDHPKDYYTASLFGEVMALSADDKNTKFYYPHQIVIDNNSPQRAIVQQSYFQGENYLLRLLTEKNQELFVYHFEFIAKNVEVGWCVKDVE